MVGMGVEVRLVDPGTRVSGLVLTACPPPPALPATFGFSFLLAPFAMFLPPVTSVLQPLADDEGLSLLGMKLGRPWASGPLPLDDLRVYRVTRGLELGARESQPSALRQARGLPDGVQ